MTKNTAQYRYLDRFQRARAALREVSLTTPVGTTSIFGKADAPAAHFKTSAELSNAETLSALSALAKLPADIQRIDQVPAKLITRADVQKLCTDENSIIDFLAPSWQVAGNSAWSASAHRVAEGTILIRTMLDDELREWGVLDEEGWAEVRSRVGSYDDFARVLRVAKGMRAYAIYGEHRGQPAADFDY